MSNLDDLDLKSEQSANSSSVYEHYRPMPMLTMSRTILLSLTVNTTVSTMSSKISKKPTVLRILMPQPVVLAMLS